MIIRRVSRSFVIAPLIAPLGLAAAFVALGAAQSPEAPGDALVAGFKSTYPASVSDAVELVTGRNGTMRHDMKLMTGANLVGRAVTAIARPAPAAQATPALSTRHSVEMIDEAKPGEVGVIVMEGTLDIAAMGNLMATAAVERGMAGNAAAVLKQAQAIDDRERGMYPFIREFKSLQKAIAKFNRI
jgi:hypothetical protein